MRRWRIPFLLLVIFPVYTWFLTIVSLVLHSLILVADEDFDFSDIGWSEFLRPDRWYENVLCEQVGQLGVLAPAALVALTQLIFLLPVSGFQPRLTRHGHSLILTVVSASLVAGFLSASLLLGIFEIFNVWHNDGGSGIANWFDQNSGRMDIEFSILWFFWICIILSWIFWFPFLLFFARRSKRSRLHERFVFLLLAGTVLETLVIIPIDIMVRRRTDCYCGTGTFFALCISTWAWIWLAGPAIVLPLLSKRRKLLVETHCLKCGYSKGPTPGPKCPECGYEWETVKADKKEAVIQS